MPRYKITWLGKRITYSSGEDEDEAIDNFLTLVPLDEVKILSIEEIADPGYCTEKYSVPDRKQGEVKC